jgi:hypothetical protein
VRYGLYNFDLWLITKIKSDGLLFWLLFWFYGLLIFGLAAWVLGLGTHGLDCGGLAVQQRWLTWLGCLLGLGIDLSRWAMAC